MSENELYNKIEWIHKMPEVILDNILSQNRLKNLSKRAREGLIFKIIETLSQYFSVVPDYYYDPSCSESGGEEDIGGLNVTLLTWLNGLSDLSVCQIIDGLLDILNMKTKYKEWPPKSVMQFHAVCKAIKPAVYHEIKTFKQIGVDSQESKSKSEKISHMALSEMFRMLGKDYEKIRMDKIKKSST